MDACKLKEKMNNDLFVREPVNEINKKIDECSDSVIVLTGNRGSGRSSILLAKERENVPNSDIAIYHHFDHVGIGVSSEDFGIDFIKHRFELEMAGVLLHFLKEHGILTQQDEIIEKEVKKLRWSTTQDIMNCSSHKFKTPIVSQGYYVEDLINEIRTIFNTEKLSFLIDRFDWMFNRNPKAQECISNYFPLFDKVVLTTDDENYSANYKTLEVDYGKRVEIVKEIINRYIASENAKKSLDEQLDINFIDEETLKYVMAKADGDIDSILYAINNVHRSMPFCTNEKLNESLKNEICERVVSRQRIRKSGIPPKFSI